MKPAKSSRSLLFFALVGLCWGSAQAQMAPGSDVDSLLALARENNPDYAGTRHEAAAAAQRVEAAGALSDPRLRTELMDVTRGGEQSATLLPGRAGSTRYLLMQDIPWWGKRDLKRDLAQREADGATATAAASWNDLAAQIRTLHAQRYYLAHRERLTREILDLLVRLEGVAQLRYASGLAAQQDVIRAQVEQTTMRNELIALDTEQRQLSARMNALLGRPATAPLASPERLRALPAPAQLDYASLEERARARNPLLAVDSSRIDAAEKSRELAYKNRYPDFTLGVAPNQFQNELKQWDLMLEMNIPLQQSSRRAQEREAEAMLAAARSRREATANRIVGELAETIAALDAAQRTGVLVRDSLLPQAELTFRAALAGYENGKLDFATLLDAQRQIRQAKLDEIRSRAEVHIRVADIERIIGEEL